MPGPSPWWEPARHQDRRARLVLRQKLVAALRAYFEADGFIETACAILQASPGNEAHLHALSASTQPAGGAPTRLYLHTSPEFAMKKLLAAGERRLFEFARVFRDREGGPLHATEFTMLEWYRANEGYEAVIFDSLALIRLAAETAGTTTLRFRAAAADLAREPERLTVADAFRRHAGVDLLASLNPAGEPRRAVLAEAAEQAGIRIAEADTWSDIFSRVLAERVMPHLGQGRVTVLDEYPRPEAALARPSPRDPRVSERFEIFAAGVELANGFGELTDAAEQRRRLVAEMDEKERLYGERYPLDEEFLAALEIMPPASGVALGFERLVMLASDAHSIEDVMWTPPASQGRQG